MAHKTLINGTAYEISGGRTLVNGTGYSIDKGKTLVDGTAYEINFIKRLGKLDVGESVYFNVNGVPTEFFVIQQGLPSSEYDSSCDGTWLLMKNIYESRSADGDRIADYENTDLHNYLNNGFLNMFDSNIKSSIKQVKLPYTKGAGKEGVVAAGASGISTKVFLLSATELNYKGEGTFVEGVVLDYFKGTGALSSKRIAYLNGTAAVWWLRSPHNRYSSDLFGVNARGGFSYCHVADSYGVRPAIIMPSDFVIN